MRLECWYNVLIVTGSEQVSVGSLYQLPAGEAWVNYIALLSEGFQLNKARFFLISSLSLLCESPTCDLTTETLFSVLVCTVSIDNYRE